MKPSAVVISVATDQSGYIDTLADSCRRHDFEFDMRGMGEQWQGFGWRMNTAVLAACEYSDSTLIVFADAYDVIICDNASRLRHMYRMTRKPFVVGVYRYIRALAGPMAKHEFGMDNLACGSRRDSPYQIPCAGVWITTAKMVKTYLRPMVPFARSMDDQRFLNQLISRQRHLFYIDCGLHFVMHAFPETLSALVLEQPQVAKDDDLYVANQRLVCGKMHTRPVILHGIGNTDLDPLLHDLGYAQARYNVSTQYVHKKMVYHMQEFIKGAYHNVLRRLHDKTNDDSYCLACALLSVAACLYSENWFATAAHAAHTLMRQQRT